MANITSSTHSKMCMQAENLVKVRTVQETMIMVPYYYLVEEAILVWMVGMRLHWHNLAYFQNLGPKKYLFSAHYIRLVKKFNLMD